MFTGFSWVALSPILSKPGFLVANRFLNFYLSLCILIFDI